MKYVYFVQNEKVTRFPFSALLKCSDRYLVDPAGKRPYERREIARQIVSKSHAS